MCDSSHSAYRAMQLAWNIDAGICVGELQESAF